MEKSLAIKQVCAKLRYAPGDQAEGFIHIVCFALLVLVVIESNEELVSLTAPGTSNTTLHQP